MSFCLPVRVYWEDTDAGGVVFYANYLKFMERARTEWLRSLGVEQRELREQAGGLFVGAEAHLNYRRPARLDDLLHVSANLQSLGSASLIIAQRVSLAPEAIVASRATSQPAAGASATPLPVADSPASSLLCEGRIRIGWVDAASMRPARLPSTVKGTLERFVRSMPEARTP